MLFFGSKDGSRSNREIASMLGLTNKRHIEDYAFNYFSMLLRYDALRSSLAGAQVEFANRIYIHKDFTPNPDYVDLMRSYFLTDLGVVDYGRAQEAVVDINNFVETKTRGLIRNLLDEDSVDGDTVMNIINAIYFKAAWKYRFNRAATSPRRFFYASGRSYVHDNTMFVKGTFRVADLPRLNARVLELPYEDEDFRMLIYLADDVDGVARLDRAAANRRLDLTNIDDYLEQGTYRVSLPKFKLEEKADVAGVIRALGATSIFDAGRADLSDIAPGPLYVQHVTHQAVVEVTEEGTEAAAATAVGVGLRTHVPDNRENSFIVDKPFIFVIQDREYNIPLFVGKVVRPDGGDVRGSPAAERLVAERAGDGQGLVGVGQDRVAVSDLPPCTERGDDAYTGVYDPSVSFPCRGRDTKVVEAAEEEGRRTVERRMRESRSHWQE